MVQKKWKEILDEYKNVYTYSQHLFNIHNPHATNLPDEFWHVGGGLYDGGGDGVSFPSSDVFRDFFVPGGVGRYDRQYLSQSKIGVTWRPLWNTLPSG